MAAAPPELRPWLAKFEWSLDGLWALRLPERDLPISRLRWVLDRPWWRGEDGVPFRIRPSDREIGMHEERMAQADLSWPLHVMRRRGQWVVLDGVHRLLKASRLGHPATRVRVVSAAALRSVAIERRRDHRAA